MKDNFAEEDIEKDSLVEEEEGWIEGCFEKDPWIWMFED